MNTVSINCCHLIYKKQSYLLITPDKFNRLHFSKYLETNFHFCIQRDCFIDLTAEIMDSLHAIIILHSETSDYIEITSNKQALSALLTECEVDIRDKACVQQSCLLISQLINHVPVITLHYNTIENSANLLFNYLHTKKIPD